MTIAIIIAVLAIGAALWVFLFMAKRAVRWAIRLALLGVVLLALLLGAVAWWWYGAGSGSSSGGSSPASQRENRPAANRRSGSR